MAETKQLPFLSSEHPIYARMKAGWESDEMRGRGGRELIDEDLVPFRLEQKDNLALRRKTARYPNFADAQASTIAGWLARKAPTYTYGPLGDVRPLEEIDDPSTRTLAEAFHYNCDGLGNDGSQVPAFLTNVRRMACFTGVRWLMAEMPTLEDLRQLRERRAAPDEEIDMTQPPTEEEMLDGWRTYLCHWGPLEVHNWKFVKGVLVWAVIWVPVPADADLDDQDEMLPDQLGRYLLVRKGYQGLGNRFAEGGWWLFDEEHEEISRGAGWPDCDGEIPLWLQYAVKDDGMPGRPSMGRSLTTELGQIGVDIMNTRSEQRHNLRIAAKTVTYILGANPDSHGDVVEQLEGESIVIAVESVVSKDGTTVVTPTIWNSSQAAIDAGAFQTVIDGGVAEAREFMVKQVTASPDASGESRKVDFEASSSPLLARMAENCEQSDNTMLHFVIKRMLYDPATGTQRVPGTSSVEWTRDFELRDVVADIDGVIATIKAAGLSSPTLEVKSVLERARRADLLQDETEAGLIKRELEESAGAREDRKNQEAGMIAELSRMRNGGGPNPPGDAGAPEPPQPPPQDTQDTQPQP